MVDGLCLQDRLFQGGTEGGEGQPMLLLQAFFPCRAATKQRVATTMAANRMSPLPIFHRRTSNGAAGSAAFFFFHKGIPNTSNGPQAHLGVDLGQPPAEKPM